MKKMRTWIAALLLYVPACAGAHETTPLPQSVRDLVATAHPGYAIKVHDGWGSDAGGQFALVISKDKDNILCMAEKAQGDAAYALTIDNTDAVYDGEQLPSLLIDTGGDSLFYGYQDEAGNAVHIHTEKQDGKWTPVDVTVYENLNGGYRSVNSGVFDDYLCYDENMEDANGNLLTGFRYAPIPVGAAFEAAMAPQNFNLSLYHADPSYGLYQMSKMPGLAESWLEEGERLIAIDLKADHVIMLLEQENGKKKLRVANAVADIYTISESGELPRDVGMDAFHTGEDALILTRDGGMALYGFERTWDDGWRLAYFQAEEGTEILPDGVRGMEMAVPKRNDGVIYGSHPWNNLFAIDFDALPTTTRQAAERIDQSAYALVHNPNPEDRLHLRIKPDKSAQSLGKFYNRTPVYVLERGKTWTKVRIGSEARGLSGYMMTKYLVFDEREKAALACAFPQKHLLEKYQEGGVHLHSEPSSRGALDDRFFYGTDEYIIGVSGNDWYLVMDKDGGVGYVPQQMFFDGNG